MTNLEIGLTIAGSIAAYLILVGVSFSLPKRLHFGDHWDPDWGWTWWFVFSVCTAPAVILVVTGWWFTQPSKVKLPIAIARERDR